MSNKTMTDIINHEKKALTSFATTRSAAVDFMLQEAGAGLVLREKIRNILRVPQGLEDLTLKNVRKEIFKVPGFIKPRHHYVDTIIRRKRCARRWVSRSVKKHFHYFGIEDQLAAILTKEELFELIRSETRSQDYIIRTDLDGTSLRHNDDLLPHLIPMNALSLP